MANTTLAPVLETAPRFIRAKNAPTYLGMCRAVFAETVRPYIREFPIGKQGVYLSSSGVWINSLAK